MPDYLQDRHRSIWLVLGIIAAIVALPRAAAAQQTTEYLSADEYIVTRPAACPLYLRTGFSGWYYGVPHANREWSANWTRNRVLSNDYSLARYEPANYDGYASGSGSYIDSRDGPGEMVYARDSCEMHG